MTSKITLENEDSKKRYENDILANVFGSQKVKLYKLKNWIFDFGGVMIENTFVIKNLINIIESDLKVTIPRSDESHYRKLRRQVGSGIISSRVFLEKLFNTYYYPYQNQGGSLPSKRLNVDYYLELWFQLYSKFARLSTEMEKIVNYLHQAGYIVSLMSNTFDLHARSNELRGFYNMFDHVFLSNEIGLRKPDLAKYKYVIKKLKTKPKKCVFIDDKLQNLIPARQIGMNVIKFESIEKFIKQLEDLGIQDLSKLSRREIKKKYNEYKLAKKKFKKSKKEYEKAKKDYLKSSSKSSEKKKLELQQKYDEFIKQKAEYEKAKQKKKSFVSRVYFH
ncbi:MAG: HAD-IA family hydrolase [Promethearchaeota archaeon]